MSNVPDSVFHLGNSDSNPGWSTKAHKPHSTEEKKKEMNKYLLNTITKQARMDGQKPMTNGKSNTKHTGTHNETHTKKKE